MHTRTHCSFLIICTCSCLKSHFNWCHTVWGFMRRSWCGNSWVKSNVLFVLSFCARPHRCTSMLCLPWARESTPELKVFLRPNILPPKTMPSFKFSKCCLVFELLCEVFHFPLHCLSALTNICLQKCYHIKFFVFFGAICLVAVGEYIALEEKFCLHQTYLIEDWVWFLKNVH